MLVVYVLEFLLYAALVFGLGTQVIVPLWKGTVLFPIFRKQGKLERVLTRAREETEEASLEEDLAKEIDRGERIRAGTRRRGSRTES